MCFSPGADLVAGVALGALAVDALRRHPRRSDLPLALVPAVLAAHSLIESVVWFAGRGQVSHAAGTIATYAYLFIAFVVLPVLVPFAVRAREPDPVRRRALIGLLCLGGLVSGVLLAAIIAGPVSAALERRFIQYHADIPAAGLVVAAYVVVTCGAGLLSSSPAIRLFAVANAVAVAILVLVSTAGLTSLWCGWAVLTSTAIVVQIRRDERDEKGTRVVGRDE